jgi:sugar/nucleoside kinase (ribokinase family)
MLYSKAVREAGIITIMNKPLIIGSVHTDLIAHVNHLPKGNEEMESGEVRQSIGGTGYMAAYTFQGFGFEYELIAPNGTGAYGEYADQECEKQSIPLKCRSDEVSGCTYRMIDPENNQSVLVAPGCEYDFDIRYTDDLYPKEISCVLVYSEMLAGTGTDDLLETLEDLNKPIYLVIGSDIEDWSEATLKHVYDLHPQVILEDTTAFFLLHEEYTDIKNAAEALQKLTSAPVSIVKEGVGVCVADGEESYIAPEKEKMNIVLQSAGYVLALNAGVDKKNAVMFANHLSSMTNGEMMDDYDFEEQKRRLAGIILHK